MKIRHFYSLYCIPKAYTHAPCKYFCKIMKIIISKFYGNPCNAILFPPLSIPPQSSFSFVSHIGEMFPRHLLKPCTKITPAHPYPFCHVFKAKFSPICPSTYLITAAKALISFFCDELSFFINMFPPAVHPVQHLFNRIHRWKFHFFI